MAFTLKASDTSTHPLSFSVWDPNLCLHTWLYSLCRPEWFSAEHAAWHYCICSRTWKIKAWDKQLNLMKPTAWLHFCNGQLFILLEAWINQGNSCCTSLYLCWLKWYTSYCKVKTPLFYSIEDLIMSASYAVFLPVFETHTMIPALWAWILRHPHQTTSSLDLWMTSWALHYNRYMIIIIIKINWIKPVLVAKKCTNPATSEPPAPCRIDSRAHGVFWISRILWTFEACGCYNVRVELMAEQSFNSFL